MSSTSSQCPIKFCRLEHRADDPIRGSKTLCILSWRRIRTNVNSTSSFDIHHSIDCWLIKRDPEYIQKKKTTASASFFFFRCQGVEPTRTWRISHLNKIFEEKKKVRRKLHGLLKLLNNDSRPFFFFFAVAAASGPDPKRFLKAKKHKTTCNRTEYKNAGTCRRGCSTSFFFSSILNFKSRKSVLF